MASIVSIRFEDDFLKNISEVMKGNNYSTKAEFIREAVRDKIKDIETEKALIKLEKIYGSSKRKSTKNKIRKAKKEAFKDLVKSFD